MKKDFYNNNQPFRDFIRSKKFFLDLIDEFS